MRTNRSVCVILCHYIRLQLHYQVFFNCLYTCFECINKHSLKLNLKRNIFITCWFVLSLVFFLFFLGLSFTCLLCSLHLDLDCSFVIKHIYCFSACSPLCLHLFAKPYDFSKTSVLSCTLVNFVLTTSVFRPWKTSMSVQLPHCTLGTIAFVSNRRFNSQDCFSCSLLIH